jgi:hypothetical protein
LTLTVTPGLAVWKAVTTSARAFFGTASERLDPKVTLPVTVAVEGTGVPELADEPVVAVEPAVAVWVAVGLALADELQAARTAGSTVSPAAPTSPFFRTSRLETCPPESKPARFS